MTDSEGADQRSAKPAFPDLELLLVATYVGLALYFLVACPEPVWLLVALLAAALVALRRAGGPAELQAPGATGLGASVARTLRRLPLHLFALPMPLAAAWFAGQRAIATTPTNYWVAFGLWLGAIVLFLVLIIPWSWRFPQLDAGWWRSLPWVEIAALTALTLAAFGARIVDIVDMPKPFSGDESNFALQSYQAASGELHNMFSTGVPFGQPSIYYFLVAGFYKVLGVGVLGDRLPSVLFGTLTVPLLYLLLRDFFDRRVAMAGAAFIAVYHLGVHFSRLGMNNISATFIVLLSLWLLGRALRTERPLYFGLAGAAAGFTLYSYIGVRVLPIVMGLWLAAVVVRERGFLFRNLSGMILLVAGFLVVGAPQGLLYLDQPDQFNAGMNVNGAFESGWLERETEVRHQTEAQIMLDQVRRGFGVLLVYPETFPHYNAQEPLIDAFSRVPFLIGGLWALFRIWQPRNVMLMSLLVLTALLGGAFSVPPPSAARYVTMIPSVAAFVALGVVKPLELAAQWRPQVWNLAAGAAVGILALLAFVNLQFYFGHYVHTDQYSSSVTRTNDAVGQYLASLGPDYIGYLYLGGPFHAHEPSVAFRARDEILLDVQQGSSQLPRPPEPKPNAVFVAAPEQEASLAAVESACPEGTWRRFLDEHGQPQFVAYEVQGIATCLPTTTRGWPANPRAPSWMAGAPGSSQTL